MSGPDSIHRAVTLDAETRRRLKIAVSDALRAKAERRRRSRLEDARLRRLRERRAWREGQR